MKGYHSLWSSQLKNGLLEMSISLTDEQQVKLLDYLALLLKWNKAFNLTAIRDTGEMVSRQLLDSLSILQWIKGARILDVGTGPGLPGIPLAITLPDNHFTLLDSNGKKTRFLQQAVSVLELHNVEVIRDRVETFQPETPFDTITSRAFTSLSKLLQLTPHLIAQGGQYLAMKGVDPIEELEELVKTGKRIETIPLSVPQTSGARHVVIIR